MRIGCQINSEICLYVKQIVVVLFFLASGIFLSQGKASQITDTVLMVYPEHFKYNTETAYTNIFQKNVNDSYVKEKAFKEFTEMVKALRDNGIRVFTLPSKKEVETPDAVFPNNWFVLFKDHKNLSIVLFPMFNKVRRLERQEDNLRNLLLSNGIEATQIVDLTHFERENKALEGTGSLVLDRQNKIAYASISQRTDEKVLEEFSKISGYKNITFKSYDKSHGSLIYHTNVMMSIGDRFAVVCSECIKDPQERKKVTDSLKAHAKNVILISFDQMNSMCGNILQVKNLKGEKIIIMSKKAFESFTQGQLKKLEKFGKILSVEIPTIETIGGGSARCMLAEIFY